MSSSAWFAPWPRCYVQEGAQLMRIRNNERDVRRTWGARRLRSSKPAPCARTEGEGGRRVRTAHCRIQVSTYTAEVFTDLDYLVRGPHQLTDTEGQLTVRAPFEFVLALLVHRAPSLFLLGFPQIDAETLNVSICSRSDKEA